MKKGMHRLLMLTAAALMALVAGCDMHTSANGDLDGFWQLIQVDTLSTGRSGDVRSQRVFWMVQGSMLEMRDLHDLDGNLCHEAVNFRFTYSGSTLSLYEPIVSNREISDSLVTQSSTLEFYGLSQLEPVLDVLRLDGYKMILQSDRYKMYFNRY